MFTRRWAGATQVVLKLCLDFYSSKRKISSLAEALWGNNLKGNLLPDDRLGVGGDRMRKLKERAIEKRPRFPR